MLTSYALFHSLLLILRLWTLRLDWLTLSSPSTVRDFHQTSSTRGETQGEPIWKWNSEGRRIKTYVFHLHESRTTQVAVLFSICSESNHTEKEAEQTVALTRLSTISQVWKSICCVEGREKFFRHLCQECMISLTQYVCRKQCSAYVRVFCAKFSSVLVLFGAICRLVGWSNWVQEESWLSVWLTVPSWVAWRPHCTSWQQQKGDFTGCWTISSASWSHPSSLQVKKFESFSHLWCCWKCKIVYRLQVCLQWFCAFKMMFFSESWCWTVAFVFCREF